MSVCHAIFGSAITPTKLPANILVPDYLYQHAHVSAIASIADMPREAWDQLISKEKWHNVELRDSRYNQVIHLTTAADGAEEFYTTDEHVVRHEGPELARELDHKVAQVRLLIVWCCGQHSLLVTV